MPRISLLPAIGSCVLLVLSGCDFELRRTTTSRTLPQELEGEWVGSWRSNRTAASGQIVVGVQEFEGQALLQFQIDNPCLQPGDYELSVRNGHIELRKAGVKVLDAFLQGKRTLVGNYDCADDGGTLTATWQRFLPPPLDLSGTWRGTLVLLGHPPILVELALEQSLRGVVLGLDGTVAIPELAISIPVQGDVYFRDAGFDLRLQSAEGFAPRVRMSGFGDRDPVQVEFGLFQVEPGSLPFSQGVFQIVRTPE
jgi:hypothetical protein